MKYLRRLREALPQVLDSRPEIVYFQAGVDGLATDRLGRLFAPQGLVERDRMVLEACRLAGVPLVITLGGGYSEPMELTVEAHANTYRSAAAIFAEPPAAIG